MNIAWVLRRLLNMSPREFLHRVVEQTHRASWRRVRRDWSRWRAPALVPLAMLAQVLDGAPAPIPAALAEEAARILAGRFAALGRDWPVRPAADLFPQEFWRLDPVTGSLWPDAATYCFDIDFRHDGSRGDVKYVWEPNRLQDLVLLAADWRLNRRTESLAALEQAIASWHAANPPFGGIGWASGIEVALRAIGLVLTLSLGSDGISAATRELIGQILAASRHWLLLYPSLHSSANNHRVAELAGLVAIAATTGGDVDTPMLAIERELLLQINADGSPAEQSPNYGAFTAELALLSLAMARAANRPEPPRLAGRLTAFARYCRWLGPARLMAPGDDDEGRVVREPGGDGDYPAAIAAAICPDRTDMPGLRSRLLGLRRPAPPHDAFAGLQSFPDGGLTMFAGEVAGRRLRLGFDHGPLGYLSIAAHGHADALALTLSIDGVPVLVDPGTYLYGSGGEWRAWLRGTRAHNTVTVAGENQSRIAGAFNWVAHAGSRLVGAVLTETGFMLSGEHDGYLRRFGAMHQRRIVLDGAVLKITDILTASAPLPAELVWQLGPGVSALAREGGLALEVDGTPLAMLRLPEGAIDIRAGEPGPQGGWVSPAFGTLVPAARVSWTGRVGADGIVTTLRILPRDA